MSGFAAEATAVGSSVALIAASVTAAVGCLAFVRPRLALYATFALVPAQFLFVPVFGFHLSPADGAVLACTAGLVARLAPGTAQPGWRCGYI